jgi:hypothetical protein
MPVVGCSLWIQFTYVTADGRVLENWERGQVFGKKGAVRRSVMWSAGPWDRPAAARVSTSGGCGGWNMQSVGSREMRRGDCFSVQVL